MRCEGPGSGLLEESTAGQGTLPFLSSLGISPQETLARRKLPVSIRMDEEEITFSLSMWTTSLAPGSSSHSGGPLGSFRKATID